MNTAEFAQDNHRIQRKGEDAKKKIKNLCALASLR
jgi:hypothetical protein